jgi:para-aminobenzoate synthetase / 4-amino-4-deoxychorismate lyase
MPDDSAGFIQWRVTCALDPFEVLARMGGRPGLTGLIGSWAGGGALITSDPVASATSISDIDEDPAADLGDGMAAMPDPAGFVGGGWFGVLGYQLGRSFERLPAPPVRPAPVPELRMSYFDHVLRYDAAAGTWWFESMVRPGRRDRAERQYREIVARLRDQAPAPCGYQFGPFRMTPAPAAHQDAVARCLDHITAGDIFQANICLRAAASFQGDPLEAFIRGVRKLRPAYAAYVTTSRGVVASFSPELFLSRRGRTVLTSPIKGTAPLSADPRDLVSSRKDQAENTMIVDLMRNDLSRVCLPGSVHVPSRARAEAHTGVWHLVRDISGTLRADIADSHLIRATFPPGSVTGAPKVRAMDLINQLETTGREAYTGAIGYSSAGRLEMNVAIRTFEFLGGTAWIGVGGGIVLDSDPAKEMRECLDKLQPLLTAVGAALDEPAPDQAPGPRPADTSRPAAGRDDAAITRRPEAGPGVFETMLVTGGKVSRLTAHLERLSASVRDLYSASLPDGLERRIRARARACAGRGRLRVVVTPGRDLESITLTPLGDLVSPPVTLVPVQIPDGWGQHKWVDRAVLDRDGDGAPWPPGRDALIMDGQELLESGRASLFLVDDDGVHTPRLDGRLLPGTTRRQVIDVLDQAGIPVHEHRLTLTDLSRATEVFVTNAIHGVTAVAGCTALPGRAWELGPLTAWLQSRFRDKPHASPWHRPVTRARVLLVDNYDSFVFNLARYCEELGACTNVLRNDDPELDPESIARRYDHVIVSPGPGDPASAGRSVEMVRLLAGVLPILGVCLGHQCIGEAFGGQTVRAPRPVHGRQALIRHDQQGIFAGLPPLLAAGRYHSLVTDESTLPGVLIPTARTPAGLLMGVRHRDLPVHGIQVHPESILTPRGHDLLANFLAIPAPGSSSPAGEDEQSAPPDPAWQPARLGRKFSQARM